MIDTGFTSGAVAYSMRRTDQDRKPPRRVLTGLLLGDPDPQRLEKAEMIRARHAVRAINYPMHRSGGDRE